MGVRRSFRDNLVSAAWVPTRTSGCGEVMNQRDPLRRQAVAEKGKYLAWEILSSRCPQDNQAMPSSDSEHETQERPLEQHTPVQRPLA